MMLYPFFGYPLPLANFKELQHMNRNKAKTQPYCNSPKLTSSHVAFCSPLKIWFIGFQSKREQESEYFLPSLFALFSLHLGRACWVVVGASVDGQWQEWSSWSDCSVTCANGTQQRTRQCSAAAHGGSECRGHWAESRECHNPDCTGKILSLLILYPLSCLNQKS